MASIIFHDAGAKVSKGVLSKVLRLRAVLWSCFQDGSEEAKTFAVFHSIRPLLGFFFVLGGGGGGGGAG